MLVNFFFVLLTVDYKTVRETFYELPELSLYYSNCSLHQKRRRTILDLNYTAQNATLTLFLSVREGPSEAAALLIKISSRF